MSMIRRRSVARNLSRQQQNPVASWYAVLLAAMVVAAALLGSAQAHAAPAANPAEAFVQQNVDRGYEILNSTTLSDEQRHTQFRDFMLSLTDARRIGLFTLGQYANQASKEDVEAFITAFSEYAVAVYESRLGKYKGQTVRVTGSAQRAADDTVVNAEVVAPNTPNAQPFKAAFRVRKTSDGRPIVTDMQVEGIWLALSQRSDFTGFLQQHGGRVPDLTSDLERQTQMLRNAGRAPNGNAAKG
jgi:phospholipid transport system substrate-binding protein